MMNSVRVITLDDAHWMLLMGHLDLLLFRLFYSITIIVNISDCMMTYILLIVILAPL